MWQRKHGDIFGVLTNAPDMYVACMLKALTEVIVAQHQPGCFIQSMLYVFNQGVFFLLMFCACAQLDYFCDLFSRLYLVSCLFRRHDRL